jgi:hypothetical protein
MDMNWSKHTKVKIGAQYGRAKVLNRQPNNKHGGAMFECKCECGKIFTAYGGQLSSGQTTQCGKCGRKPHLDRLHEACRLDPGKAARHATFLQTKRSSVIRGIKWDLSESDFHAMSQLPCHYCGDTLSNCKKGKRGIYGEHRYNGIDRVESTKGYEAGNMVPCCWRCNRSKCDMSVSEFLEWADRLYSHQHRS